MLIDYQKLYHNAIVFKLELMCDIVAAERAKVGAVEPPNKGQRTLWEQPFCPPLRGCPLFGGKNELLLWERGPELTVSFVGRLSLSQRVLYRRFHCSLDALIIVTQNAKMG